MVICEVFGCSKRSGRDKEASFFRFPCADMKRQFKQKALILLRRQKLWITRTNRSDLDKLKVKNARICNLHFISGKPSSLEDIDNPDWAPTLNLGNNEPKHINVAVQRYQRAVQRNQRKFRQDQRSGQPSHTLADSQVDDLENPPESISSQGELQNTYSSTFQPSTSSSVIDASSSSDLTMDNIVELERIKKDHEYLSNEYLSIKNKVSFENMNVEDCVCDEQIKFYTGLPSAKLLNVIFEYVKHAVSANSNNNLTKFQEMLLFLMRLRLNLLTQDLAYRFNISQPSVCRIFFKWLDVMYIKLKNVVFWPNRDVLLKSMPLCFKDSFESHVAVIIDCFEIIINRPTSLDARAYTWSNYKQRNTVKYLVGITPQGVISFISLGWGGRASDKHISEHCGIFDHLLPRDIVLADRGFNNLNSVGFYCAELVLPASARGKKQLSPTEVHETRKTASLRIHVERVIGQLRKKFRILKGTLPTDLLFTGEDKMTQIDKIVHVCCALVNMMPSVVPMSYKE